MTQMVLQVLHIAVLGYWLGSELVINSEYRFVVRRADLPVAARDAMTDHLMHADQHVRYALVLQAALGVMLMAELGLVAAACFWIALVCGIAWLALVETVHRLRRAPVGGRLAAVDRLSRYAAAALLVAAALMVDDWPDWLRLKLALFAGVIGCGVLIRLQLVRHFQVWGEVLAQGSNTAREGQLRAICRQATGILLVLWGLIAAITLLAVIKPG